MCTVIALAGSPVSCCAVAVTNVAAWVGTQISHDVPRKSTVQFSTSMHTCGRYGT